MEARGNVMKARRFILILAAAVALSSCATMPKESPILELDNIALDVGQ